MGVVPIVVFVVTYALYALSGLFFRIDFTYYDALKKPSYTPPGNVIAIVWGVLFACIAGAFALLVARLGLGGIGVPLLVVVAVNWLSNQAYSYIQFTRKQWLPAAIDGGVVAVTAFGFIAMTWAVSPLSAVLFVPYALWATFATYLSYVIWSLNR